MRIELNMQRFEEAMEGHSMWRVEYFSDLSAAWLMLPGAGWHACVEMGYEGGLRYYAWLAIDESPTESEEYIKLGPFDSIEAARRCANSMASQWLIDSGRQDEALKLGESLPDDIWSDLRSPEDLSYIDDVAEPEGDDEFDGFVMVP